jgi:hypothetical protein
MYLQIIIAWIISLYNIHLYLTYTWCLFTRERYMEVLLYIQLPLWHFPPSTLKTEIFGRFNITYYWTYYWYKFLLWSLVKACKTHLIQAWLFACMRSTPLRERDQDSRNIKGGFNLVLGGRGKYTHCFRSPRCKLKFIQQTSEGNSSDEIRDEGYQQLAP